MEKRKKEEGGRKKEEERHFGVRAWLVFGCG